MNRRGFLAATAAASAFVALPAWAMPLSLEEAILSAKYRTVWVTTRILADADLVSCPEVTRVMREMKRHGRSISVTVVHRHGRTAHAQHNTENDGIQDHAPPRHAAPVRYAVVYQPEYSDAHEGDIVSLMRMRTDTYVGGKLIVVSRDTPPPHLKDVAHFWI